MTGTTDRRPVTAPPLVSRETAGARWRPGRPTRAVVVMALLGIAIRLVLAPLTSYPNDDLPWYWMTVSGMQHLPVYARPGFSYPPIWGWVLELLGRVLHGLGASPATLGVHDLTLNRADMATGGGLATVVTSPLLNSCIKGLLSAADLGTALLLAGTARVISDRRRAGELAFGLYFLNPLVIDETAVRAGIDGLVALSIAATLAMVCRRRPLLAGVALGAGVFVKLTPALLAPLVLAALVSAGQDRQRRWGLSQVRSFVAGGLAVTAPVVLVVVGTGQWGGFLENTFSRAQTGLLIGGPGLGGLRHFAALAGLLQVSARHSGAVLDASLAVEAAVVLSMTAWTWGAARRSVPRALVLASTVVLAVVVLTTPTSQPSYVLWLLVPLVLLAAARPWGYAPFVVVLSLSAVVFSLTYYGPAQVLFPLAEYTRIVNPRWVAGTVTHWFQRPTGLWGASYKEDYASICAAVSIVVYLFLVARCLDDRRFVAATGPRATVDQGKVRALPERLVLAVAGLLALALVVSSATPPPGAGSSGSTLTSAVARGGQQHITIATKRVAGEQSVRVLSFTLGVSAAVRHVYVVVDPALPLGATTLEDVRGIFDELAASLRLRGYAGAVTMIDAASFTHLLGGATPPDTTAVVDTSGVLPAGVLSPGHDLLVAWLRRGGVLYWGGGPIGLSYAEPGQTNVTTWRGGPASLLGSAAGLREDLLRQAQRATPAARALGLQYQDATYSPLLPAAVAEGATALGYLGGEASSITAFPFGAGRLVVFGGLMYANAEVASDIALIQMSDILDLEGPVLTSTHALHGTGPTTWTETVPVADALKRIVVFDPRPSGIAFSVFTLTRRSCHGICAR